jgi:chromate transporter
VWWRFLRLGAGAWGGPFVQIAALQDELVRRERWCDEDEFRRALALYQALPGPEATEMCIWLGSRVRGRLGGLCAGLGFVLPGLCLMLLACWTLFGRTLSPAQLAWFAGLQAAVVALVVRAAWRLAAPSVREGGVRAGCTLAAFAGELLGVPFAIALLGGGLVAAAAHATPDRRLQRLFVLPAAAAWLAAAVFFGLLQHIARKSPSISWSTFVPDLGDLFVVGLRAGALTFGGAYTVIPFLHADAVGGGWLGEAEFLDGLAIGGVLPAPMVVVGTWVGWAGGGLGGALLLTLGVFLPAFAMPLLLHERLDRLLANERCHALLDGVTASVVGIVAAVALRLVVTLDTPLRALLAAAALLALATLRWRHAVPIVLLAAAAVAWFAGRT